MFEEQSIEVIADARRKQIAYIRADELLEELGLTSLEPLCTNVVTWQKSTLKFDTSNPDWPDLKDTHVYRDDGRPYVYVGLYIPWDQKAGARDIIVTQSRVGRWEKTHNLTRALGGRQYLVENWEWKENREDYPKFDEVEIMFYRPAEAGTKVNGCEIVVQKSESTDLALSCSLEKHNG
jgi:hypothetical protein